MEIVEEGLVMRYLNALHDLFHRGNESSRSNYPAYVFKN